MNLLGLGLSQSRFSPRKLRPALYLSADRGVYQDAAVQFTAADKSWLQMATPFDPGTDDFIVSFWIWLDSTSFITHSVVVDTGAITEMSGFAISAHSFSHRQIGLWLKAESETRVADYTNLSDTIELAKWYHVVAVFDRSSVARVYLDGVTNGNTLDISGHQATLGTQAANAIGCKRRGGLYLDGRIDSLMFFKKPDLSPYAADIIAWAYNNGSGRLCAEITDEQKAAWGAVSGWEMAEPSGQRKDSWGTNHLDEQLGEGITEIARAPGIVRAIAANGDGVSYWQDQSTGGKHAAQITLAKRPTLVTSGINSRPVIRGDGVDDYLVVSAVSLEGAFTISAVFQLGGQPEWESSVLCGAGGFFEPVLTYIELFHSDTFNEDAVAVRCNDSTDAWFVVSPPGADPHILTVTRDASDVVRVFLDGVESSRVIQNHVELSGGPALAGEFRVETILYNEGGYFSGDIAEFLVYDGEKTAAELARLHTYLARRYGITI